MLLKNWKLNSIAVVSLAIALSLGVIALSISNTLLLRPPVGRDTGHLAMLFTSPKPGDVAGVSYLDYQYLRDHAAGFTAMAAHSKGYSEGTSNSRAMKSWPGRMTSPTITST